MSLNLSNLTEAAQKKISELSNKISIQRRIIEREEEVLKSKGDTYLCMRARTTLSNKKDRLDFLDKQYEQQCNSLTEKYERQLKELKEDHSLIEKKLLNDIEIQEKIIWDETHKENPTIIRATSDIKKLREEKDKILKAAGVFDTPAPAKQFVNEYTAPVEEKEKHNETSDVSVDFAMFMLDGRQDGKPIDPNPSWLNGISHGLCMNSKEKKKGVRMP